MPETSPSLHAPPPGQAAPAPLPGAQARIRILPEDVASRIAAGEVVERPGSVVKELVENALDAGARNVHVELAGGGRECIRVSDDGSGMGPEDLALCAVPHATSKLVTVADLERLVTLGFRGEALPSVAAVSRFTLTSRLRADQPGANAAAWRIEICGGEPQRPAPRPAGAAAGTTVEVRDLFFNVPARAKFLKGAGAEAAACADAFLRLALTRPDVSFTLRQGRHEICSLLAGPHGAAGASPCSAFLQRARDVLGRAAGSGLLEVAVAGPGDTAAASAATQALAGGCQGYRLYGLISPPAITRPNRSSIYLAVNGRPVKDRTLTSALLESCRHLLPPQRYPIAVLFLELPGADLDINVHPTKAEVRFRLPGLVYALFHHAVRTACGASSAEQRASSPEPPAAAPLAELTAGARGAPIPLHSRKSFDLWPRAPTPAAGESAPAPQQPAVRTQYAVPSAVPSGAGRVAEKAGAFAPSAPVPPAAAANRDFRILGQAGGAYIVLEDERGVKLIDQHALHERILFEELLARAEGRARGDSQGLLIAESLELSPAQAAVFAEDGAAGVLEALGFAVESFGPRSVLVRAVPAILKSAAAALLVRDVLDAMAGADTPGAAGAGSRLHFREKAVYTLACKGAIKAGERLTIEQMTALVAEYRRNVGAGGFTCPHGRPMALELSWEELERSVGRK